MVVSRELKLIEITVKSMFSNKDIQFAVFLPHVEPSLKFHINVTFTWNIACSEGWSFLYFSHSVMVDTKPLQSGRSDSLPSRVVQRYSFVAVSKQAPLRTVMVHTLLRVCSLQIYIHEKSFLSIECGFYNPRRDKCFCLKNWRTPSSFFLFLGLKNVMCPVSGIK